MLFGLLQESEIHFWLRPGTKMHFKSRIWMGLRMTSLSTPLGKCAVPRCAESSVEIGRIFSDSRVSVQLAQWLWHHFFNPEQFAPRKILVLIQMRRCTQIWSK